MCMHYSFIVQGDFSSAAATAFANLTLKELRVNSNPGLGGELDPSTNGTVCDFVQVRVAAKQVRLEVIPSGVDWSKGVCFLL